LTSPLMSAVCMAIPTPLSSSATSTQPAAGDVTEECVNGIEAVQPGADQ
jgi:hypothetical protein